MNEMLNLIDTHPLAGFVLFAMAIGFLCLLAICAAACPDDSCDPEKHCGNCSKNGSGSYDCHQCMRTAPYYCKWTPKTKEAK